MPTTNNTNTTNLIQEQQRAIQDAVFNASVYGLRMNTFENGTQTRVPPPSRTVEENEDGRAADGTQSTDNQDRVPDEVIDTNAKNISNHLFTAIAENPALDDTQKAAITDAIKTLITAAKDAKKPTAAELFKDGKFLDICKLAFVAILDAFGIGKGRIETLSSKWTAELIYKSKAVTNAKAAASNTMAAAITARRDAAPATEPAVPL